MKITLIVILLILFPISNLQSQSKKNMWLEKVDPKLLEKVDLNKIPEAPNKLTNDGKRDGDWVIWLSKSHDETTNIDFISFYRKLKYKKGQVVGNVEDYYLDDTLSAKGKIKNDKFDGEVEFYNQDGSKQKVLSYNNSKLSGKWIKYGKKNQVAVEGSYDSGERNGLWKGFHSNGKAKFSGEYYNGEKTYSWTYWDKNSKIESIKLYYNDAPISPSKAIGIIENMVAEENVDKTKKMITEYKKVIKTKFGEESTEYVNGIYLDSKLLIKLGEDKKAIELLNKLIENKKASDIILHKSLFSLNKLFKKSGELDNSIVVLNKVLVDVEAGIIVLPFERTLVTDELAEIYLEQKDYTNLELTIEKAKLNDWSELIRRKSGTFEVFQKYSNDKSISTFKDIDTQELYRFDTRVTELLYKDILVSEVNNINNNQLMDKVAKLFNLYSYLGSTDSLLKQLNPQSEVIVLERSIMESLSNKYGITLR